MVLKLHPNVSLGEANVTPLNSCNISRCHFMTASSLMFAHVRMCLCAQVLKSACVCVCTYMRKDGSMAVM